MKREFLITGFPVHVTLFPKEEAANIFGSGHRPDHQEDRRGLGKIVLKQSEVFIVDVEAAPRVSPEKSYRPHAFPGAVPDPPFQLLGQHFLIAVREHVGRAAPVFTVHRVKALDANGRANSEPAFAAGFAE